MRAHMLSTVAVVALLTVAGCSGPSEAPEGSELTTLKVGAMPIGSNAAIYLGEQKGFFEEEGLRLEFSTIANPPAGIAAAQSGQTDVTYSPGIPLLNALAQDIELTIVAPADGYPDGVDDAENVADVDETGVFVAPGSDIESAADLEGRSIAIPARKAQLEVTIAGAIEEAGGDPSTVDWLVLDPATALQSLKDGRVDAAGLISPVIQQAQDDGLELVLSPGVHFFKEGVVSTWVSGQKIVDEQPEVLAAFQRAVLKSNAYANENLEEAQEIAAEITSVPLETVRRGATSYWPSEVRISDIQDVDRRLVELGFLPNEVGVGDSLLLDNS